MFLVGPNGSGKSSFLDSVKFVADSLSTSLDHALRERGTIKEVRRRSGAIRLTSRSDLTFNYRRGPLDTSASAWARTPPAKWKSETMSAR